MCITPAPSPRYRRTRMVLYDLYAHILRATIPCTETKYKHTEVVTSKL